MNASLADMVAAIKAALQADLGTFDLSGSDAVKEGTFQQPPAGIAPFAAIEPPTVAGEPQGRARWYLRTATLTIRLWGTWSNTATAGTTGDRAARARLLMDEAMAALETARRTGGSALYQCVSFVVRGSTPDPAMANVPSQYAYATLTVEFSYRRTAGLGA